MPAMIAECAQQIRDYPKAVEFFERSIDLAPTEAWLYVTLAQTRWLWTGDLAESRRVLESAPFSAKGTRLYYWDLTESSRLGRNFDAVLDIQEKALFDWYDSQWFSFPKQLYIAEAFDFLGETESAQAGYAAALLELETALGERPADYRVHSSLGVVQAGLGRKAEAIAAGKRAVGMQPVEKEAYIGPWLVENLALIYTRVGEVELAIDELDYLLSIPSKFSVSVLRLDPRWDPLRDHPRFQELLEKYG
jgi:tetratricopeptide (TPR) repeat protein